MSTSLDAMGEFGNGFLKLRLFDKFIGKGGKGGQKFPRLGKSRNDRLKRRM